MELAPCHADDFLSYSKRGSSRRRWHIPHVQHVLRRHELEIIDQRAVGSNRLSSDACAIGNQIGIFQNWKKPLQSAHKRGLVGRTIKFAQPTLPILKSHFPESGITESFCRIPKTEVSTLIALTLEREDRVWPGINAAAHSSREVHSQKGKPQVRHRINKVLDQMFALRCQIVVFAAKGNDPNLRLFAGHQADAIALQASAVNDIARAKCPLRSFDQR